MNTKACQSAANGASARLDPRLKRVCEHIGRHLDADLSLERLSRVGHLSRFHFHRLFAAHLGVSVGRYILLQRLKRASLRLAFETERKILDIGLEAGFDSAEAFSRAFKRELGQSPSAFRQGPEWPHWHSVMNPVNPPSGDAIVDVKLVELAPLPIGYLEHKGDPARVLESVGRFVEWRKQSGLSPLDSSRTFGIPNGDPATMAADEFRFKICGTVSQTIPANDFGVQNGTMVGGRYVVARHVGSHANLDITVYGLFRDWLPQSGETVREAPLFFEYLNFIHQVEECELMTDVYLPLA